MLLFIVFFASSLAQALSIPLGCTSLTQPNPVSQDFPNDISGVINGTTAIVPIPYSVARSMVPSQYPILVEAYQKVFPSLGKDMYPAVLQAVYEHDVGKPILKIPDFSRIALKFPYVDRLNDGHTAFLYSPPQIISATNPVALLGATLYGKAVAGVFDPACDGYASNGQGETYLRAYSLLPGAQPVADMSFRPSTSMPYTTEAFADALNQPLSGPLCAKYKVMFNTTVTSGIYAPVPVKGTLTLRPPLYPTEQVFQEVQGFRMANVFLEGSSEPCEKLKENM